MTPAVQRFVAEVKRLSAATVETNSVRRTAEVRVGSQRVAHIDLRDGQLLVTAPDDTIPALQRRFPSSRPSADGIVFDLEHPRARAQALAAIRRRVRVQRLAPQFHTASP
jgi:hypothetical protein